MEYGTTQDGELTVQTILVEYVPEINVWVKVVFDGYSDSANFTQLTNFVAVRLSKYRASEQGGGKND